MFTKVSYHVQDFDKYFAVWEFVARPPIKRRRLYHVHGKKVEKDEEKNPQLIIFLYHSQPSARSDYGKQVKLTSSHRVVFHKNCTNEEKKSYEKAAF